MAPPQNVEVENTVKSGVSYSPNSNTVNWSIWYLANKDMPWVYTHMPNLTYQSKDGYKNPQKLHSCTNLRGYIWLCRKACTNHSEIWCGERDGYTSPPKL